VSGTLKKAPLAESEDLADARENAACAKSVIPRVGVRECCTVELADFLIVAVFQSCRCCDAGNWVYWFDVQEFQIGQRFPRLIRKLLQVDQVPTLLAVRNLQELRRLVPISEFEGVPLKSLELEVDGAARAARLVLAAEAAEAGVAADLAEAGAAAAAAVAEVGAVVVADSVEEVEVGAEPEVVAGVVGAEAAAPVSDCSLVPHLR